MTETLERSLTYGTDAERYARAYADLFTTVGRHARVTVYRHEPIRHGDELLDLGRIHAVMTLASTGSDDSLTLSWITSFGGKQQTTWLFSAKFGDVLGEMRDLRSGPEIDMIVRQLLRSTV